MIGDPRLHYQHTSGIEIWVPESYRGSISDRVLGDAPKEEITEEIAKAFAALDVLHKEYLAQREASRMSEEILLVSSDTKWEDLTEDDRERVLDFVRHTWKARSVAP